MNEYTHRIELSADRRGSLKYLNSCIYTGLQRGYHEFLVCFEDTVTYSNCLAPIAGILDYYSKQGNTIKCALPEYSYIAKTHVDNPYIVSDVNSQNILFTPLDRVWRFSSSHDVGTLVDAVIKYIRQSDIIEKGVIESLEWCLNETMDNVLQHSGNDYGFFMGQLHSTNKLFAFCVYDNGIGIYNSFSHSRYNPASPYDAITLALQERVTRDEQIGQGNGLWGLSEIIHIAGGELLISSAGAKYHIDSHVDRSELTGEMYFGRKNGTTMVDCQIDYSKAIDISAALGGYQPLDQWLENLQTDAGDYHIKIVEHSAGTGTRKAAAQLRNMVMNIVKNERLKCILDFSGINMISSSYADEFIGKIIVEIGIVYFMRFFSITNISANCVAIMNRSIQQRMAQVYYDADIDETDI